MNSFGKFTALMLLSAAAWALSLSDISNTDAASGLKEALSQGPVRRLLRWGQTTVFLAIHRLKFRCQTHWPKAKKCCAWPAWASKPMNW